MLPGGFSPDSEQVLAQRKLVRLQGSVEHTDRWMKSWSSAWTGCHAELQLLHPERNPTVLARDLPSAEHTSSSVWLSLGPSECKQVCIPPIAF